MAKLRSQKYFAKGAGLVIRYRNSEILLFYWHGKNDGTARAIPHVRRYSRNGAEHASLAALLRSIEAEHQLETV